MQTQRLFWSALVILAMASPSVIDAQVSGGSIVGTVIDQSGAPVPEALVKAQNIGTGQFNQVRTNSSGYYEFSLLPAGRYQIFVQHPGFQTASSEQFALNAGTRPRIDLPLTVGSNTDTVSVVASAPLVNAETTDLGKVIDGAKVEALPLNGRNFQQLVGLQAGVVNSPSSSTGGRGGIEFNGSPALGNNLLLDGVDMSFGEENGTASDVSAGSSGGSKINVVSVEAIAEFKATGSAFSAEYGRATGGVLNVTTKSGTNQFHGTLFEYFRNDALDANSFFSNLNNLPKPPLRWNQFGGNLGGPIIKNKVFFFFNYEGVHTRQNTVINGNEPTQLLLSQLPAALAQEFRNSLTAPFTPTSNPLVGFASFNASRTDDENTYLGRVDGAFGQHRLSGRVSVNRQQVLIPQLRPKNPLLYPTKFENAAFQDNWILSSNKLNEFRAGLNRIDENRNYQNLNSAAYAAITSVGINDSLNSYIHFKDTTYTIADNFSYVRGSHSFKTGFEIRVVHSSRIQGGIPTDTYATPATAIADTPSTILVLFGNPGRPLNNTDYGFYGQDEWRITRHLQLNYGLRYEYFSPFKGGYNISSSDPFGPFTRNDQPMFKPDRNNFAPRLGIIFDVFGNQKTVFRAGGGITYGPPQAIFYFGGAFINPLLPFQTTYTPSDLPPSIPATFPFPQSFIDLVASNISLLPKSFVPGRNIADYNRADEYAGQWNVSVQQALTKDLALQVSYVGSRGLKLFTTIVPNQFQPGAKTRPNPAFADITYGTDSGRSSYHALQVSLNQRLRSGLTLDVYYTWAHAMSYGGVDATVTSDSTVQDPNNFAGSYGPKAGELKHNFITVLSYSVPTPHSINAHAFTSAVLAGWNLQGIFNARSGPPINVLSGIDLVGNQRISGQRPDYIGGVDPYIRNRDALTWLNPDAFSNTIPAAAKRFGNLGYNALYAPGAYNLDAALHKTFSIHENHSLSLRLEAFNALNHMNLGAPVVTRSNPLFGKINSGSAGRNVQIALKYFF